MKQPACPVYRIAPGFRWVFAGLWGVCGKQEHPMKAGCLLPRLAGAVCLLGLLSLAAVLQAQTPAPAPQQNTQPAPAPMPLFLTQANLVLVAVVVRDPGQPVHGLKAEAFHLFEESAEQKITV